MLAAALSRQQASLSGPAATSDTLLSAAGPAFHPGGSCSWTYFEKPITQLESLPVWLRLVANDLLKWPHVVPKAQHFGAPVHCLFA